MLSAAHLPMRPLWLFYDLVAHVLQGDPHTPVAGPGQLPSCLSWVLLPNFATASLPTWGPCPMPTHKPGWGRSSWKL